MANGSFGNKNGRKDKLIKEKRHDVYEARQKLKDPALCAKCGALYKSGRWTWKEPPATAAKTTCPACRRIADGYPAGFVEVKGPFFQEHREDILHLIHNVEALEKKQHPLERIMSETEKKGQVSLTTTGIHVARAIGDALAKAYKGELSFKYPDAEKTLRVRWER
jgi:NMD protein affecting ribosome stability and mRNA decay